MQTRMPPKKLGGKYGKTTGELHEGQRQYAERQTQLSRDYQVARQRGFTGNWHDWLLTQRDRTTQVPPVEAVTPYSPTKAPPARSAGERPPVAGTSRQQLFEDPSDDTLAQLERIFGEPMNEDILQDQTVRSGGGGGVSNALGNIETANKYLKIPRTLGLKTHILHFGKSRIFYTYGYAFTQIIKKQELATVDVGDLVQLCTPLATLPADMLGFYMNQSELSTFTGTAKILKVSVSVVPQGLRTAFDFGTTLTGTATSEHVSIGCSGIGLNNLVYNRHGTYNSDAASPMKPTGVNDIASSDFVTKYYGSAKWSDGKLGMNLGIPRHVSMYMVLLSNSDRNPTGTYANKYQKNVNGWPSLDRMYDGWNFMPRVGEQVIDYHYKPVNGVIWFKNHFMPYNAHDSDTAWNPTPYFLGSKVKIQNQYLTDSKTVETAIAAEVDTSSYINVNYQKQPHMLNILLSSIDPTKQYNLHDRQARNTSIPLPYFGILQVPQLNPATDNTQFQNTCAYWSVKADLVMEVDAESLFTIGNSIHGGPQEVHLRVNKGVEANDYNDFRPGNLVTFGN